MITLEKLDTMKIGSVLHAEKEDNRQCLRIRLLKPYKMNQCESCGAKDLSKIVKYEKGNFTLLVECIQCAVNAINDNYPNLTLH